MFLVRLFLLTLFLYFIILDLTDQLEVEELAAQFVAKIGQLIGTTATREFTCHGVLYRVPPAREFMDMTAADLRAQIALVELDLIAYRSTMTEGQA